MMLYTPESAETLSLTQDTCAEIAALSIHSLSQYEENYLHSYALPLAILSTSAILLFCSAALIS